MNKSSAKLSHSLNWPMWWGFQLSCGTIHRWNRAFLSYLKWTLNFREVETSPPPLPHMHTTPLYDKTQCSDPHKKHLHRATDLCHVRQLVINWRPVLQQLASVSSLTIASGIFIGNRTAQSTKVSSHVTPLAALRVIRAGHERAIFGS